jgi:ABC-type bacteriocin/lantibiotic exporter with double-glycine peptidase domain
MNYRALITLLGICLFAAAFVSAGEAITKGDGARENGAVWTKYYQPGMCGPIALYCVSRHYGIMTNIDELAKLCEFNGRGVSIAGIVAAAERKQLNPAALHSNVEHLRRTSGPAIIDWPEGHFCVYLGWSNGQARILDPPRPLRTVSAAELESHWGKHVITFAPRRPRDDSAP